MKETVIFYDSCHGTTSIEKLIKFFEVVGEMLGLVWCKGKKIAASSLSSCLLTILLFFVLSVGRPGSQVPRLLHWNNIDSNQIVLKDVHAWHIGGALSEHELDEWKLLYHSSFSGLSFSTFWGNIT